MMNDIDLNTQGLDHNPNLAEHMRRMALSRTRLYEDGGEEIIGDVRGNPTVIAATDKNGTLGSLDSLHSLN